MERTVAMIAAIPSENHAMNAAIPMMTSVSGNEETLSTAALRAASSYGNPRSREEAKHT